MVDIVNFEPFVTCVTDMDATVKVKNDQIEFNLFSALGETDKSIDLNRDYRGDCIQDSNYRFLSDHFFKSQGLFR